MCLYPLTVQAHLPRYPVRGLWEGRGLVAFVSGFHNTKVVNCLKLINLSVAFVQKMLQHLKDKKDVGFFTSVAGLMQQCRFVCFFTHIY